jgi:hypothetical protein
VIRFPSQFKVKECEQCGRYVNLGWVNADVDCGTVELLALDAFDMDDPLLAVHLNDLAGLTLEGTTDNLDLNTKPERRLNYHERTTEMFKQHGYWLCACV